MLNQRRTDTHTQADRQRQKVNIFRSIANQQTFLFFSYIRRRRRCR